jgi:hypothetical protein
LRGVLLEDVLVVGRDGLLSEDVDHYLWGSFHVYEQVVSCHARLADCAHSEQLRVEVEPLQNETLVASGTAEGHDDVGVVVLLAAEDEVAELEQLYLHRITHVFLGLFHIDDRVVHGHVVESQSEVRVGSREVV